MRRSVSSEEVGVNRVRVASSAIQHDVEVELAAAIHPASISYEAMASICRRSRKTSPSWEFSRGQSTRVVLSPDDVGEAMLSTHHRLVPNLALVGAFQWSTR